ncbi:hypothetical protein AB4114_35705 [Paenibacillus sp. 2RAB27]|uniref:hypothetical protein n=1 Tax=Paenibacillus sp. 2RAB27 TaxID=3232991 RepID=UPI003F96E8B1
MLRTRSKDTVCPKKEMLQIDCKLNHVGEPYALVGHVRFDKGGAMQMGPLLDLLLN